MLVENHQKKNSGLGTLHLSISSKVREPAQSRAEGREGSEARRVPRANAWRESGFQRLIYELLNYTGFGKSHDFLTTNDDSMFGYRLEGREKRNTSSMWSHAVSPRHDSS